MNDVADSLKYMHDTRFQHSYGRLSRDWITNIYIDRTDIIQSLPNQLRSIFDALIKNHKSTDIEDSDDSDDNDEMLDQSSSSSSFNSSNNPTKRRPNLKNTHLYEDDKDMPDYSSSSSCSIMSVEEEML